MTPLESLEKAMEDNDYENPTTRLPLFKGVSYDTSQNQFLGLPKSPKAFHVLMPVKAWPPSTWQAPSSAPQTSLQEAFISVVDEGVDAWLKDKSAHESEFLFFTEGRDSVIHGINTALKKLSDSVPVVIRFLWGTNQDASTSQAGFWKNHLDIVESIFWDKTEGSGLQKPRIEHKNTMLHIGCYNPQLKTSEEDRQLIMHTVGKWAENLVNTMDSTIRPYITPNIKEAIEKLLSQNGISISWNHGKILAAGCKTAMTGGANYWPNYSRGNYSTIDMQAKITGDAAFAAHRYADYFWKYLQKPNVKLQGSGHRCISVGQGSTWTETTAPLFADLHHPDKSGGDIKVLTVCQLGDWYGELVTITCPVQIVDAIRDAILNIAFQTMKAHNKINNKPLTTFATIYPIMKNAYDSEQMEDLRKVGFSPAIWASRHARTHAISLAQQTIRISNQMLVNWLQVDDPHNDKYKTFVQDFNSGFRKKSELFLDWVDWDGYLWPYDHLMAFAKALKQISRAPNVKPEHGIYLVLTKIAKKDDYCDIFTTQQIRDRLIPFVKGELATATDTEAQKLVNERFHIRRVKTRMHCKTLCVDEKLLYIGSDNLYPSYNEEHGVWVEDKDAINSWRDDYWSGLWNNHSKPEA